MFAAKALERNTRCFFSKSLGDKATPYLKLNTQTAKGIQRRELIRHLQNRVACWVVAAHLFSR